MDKRKHRGMKVEQVLARKGVDINKLSRLINLNRDHIGVLFGDQFLEYDIISFIGKQVGHDFSQEFPEMKQS